MTVAVKNNSTTQLEAAPADRIWTREEYDRLVDLDFFQGQRVELVEGRIIQMSPQGVPHRKRVELVAKYLSKAITKDYRVCVQLPFRAADGSEPEPDVAVVPGEDPGEITEHPSSAILIVEVSESTLNYDRRKARLYAASNVGEYWILNIALRTLEVYQQPLPNASDVNAYASSQILQENETVAPLAAPHAMIKVAELLR